MWNHGKLAFVTLAACTLVCSACVSSSAPVPAKTPPQISANPDAKGEPYLYNGEPIGISDLLVQLKVNARVVDPTLGLTGTDERDISDNPINYSATYDGPTSAFATLIELAVESRQHKMNLCLRFTDGEFCTQVELPTDDDFSGWDKSYQLFAKAEISGDDVELVVWLSQAEAYLEPWTEEIPDEDELVFPELESAPDEPSETESDSSSSYELPKLKKTMLSRFDLGPTTDFNSHIQYDRYTDVKARIVSSLEKYVETTGIRITGAYLVFADDIDSVKWGLTFLLLDSLNRLNLKHPTSFVSE
jgi:hypothetical protein